MDPGGVDLPAAGVDEGEATAGPLGLVGDPVPSHARHVLDDGLATAEDPVDEGRLADVGAADDGDDGQRPIGLVIGPVGSTPVQEGEVGVVQLEIGEAGPQGTLDRSFVHRSVGGSIHGSVGRRRHSGIGRVQVVSHTLQCPLFAS